MKPMTRREFLEDLGRGVLIASVGSALAGELGLSAAFAGEGEERLGFGSLEPLVSLMQETPPGRLQPLLVDRLRSGAVDLRQLVGAGAFANARTFGGEDYVGYHAMMALAPALQMAEELPEARRPLPVLKVLYRNTGRIQESGGRSKEVLRPVSAAGLPEGRDPGELLRAAVRRRDVDEAERIFAAIARGPLDRTYDDLQTAVHDDLDVHRIVLVHRAYALLDVVGREHAHAMLRQSVRFCVDAERSRVRLVLRQPEVWRGSRRVHGAAHGVHACDSMNAWRNIARVSSHRNAVSNLIAAACYVAREGIFEREAYPYASHRETVRARDAEGLLREAESAMRENDQGRATAAIAIYGEAGFPERPVFDLMLRYAVSEDGRLHAEKYYRTVTEEFQTVRPAFRWRHLVALARVTASAYGYDRNDRPGHRAPGYEEACALLGV